MKKTLNWSALFFLIAVAGAAASEVPDRACGDNELWQMIAISACMSADSTELDEPALANALKTPNRIEVKYIGYNQRERELIVPASACLGRLFGSWKPYMALAVHQPKDVKPPILRFYLVNDGQLSAVALGDSVAKTFTRINANKELEKRLRGERGFWLRYFKLIDKKGKVKGCL